MVRLRPIRAADAPRFQELVEEPAVRAATNLPEPYPADGARRWIETEARSLAAGTGFAFAIVAEEELVGACAVRDIAGEPLSGVLGYWIGKPYWGRGYATEAVRQAVIYAFSERGVERLVASCLETHRASRRVLEKNGFRFVRLGPEPHPKWGPDDVFAYYRLDCPV